MKVDEATCKVQRFLKAVRVRQLNEVVGRDAALDVHGFAPDLLGLYFISAGEVLTNISVTSPCFLFCLQSEEGITLKCLKTSTNGCCQREPFP